MVNVLSQLDALSDVHRAMRDEFQKGGSILETLLALAGLAALVLLAYFLTKLQSRRAARSVKYDKPQRLFHDLLDKLSLTTEERQLLDSVSRASRLTHPSAMLLSETLFERRVSKWRERTDDPSGVVASGSRAETIGRVRARLFPGDLPRPAEDPASPRPASTCPAESGRRSRRR